MIVFAIFSKVLLHICRIAEKIVLATFSKVHLLSNHNEAHFNKVTFVMRLISVK